MFQLSKAAKLRAGEAVLKGFKVTGEALRLAFDGFAAEDRKFLASIFEQGYFIEFTYSGIPNGKQRHVRAIMVNPEGAQVEMFDLP
jgi:hypothetical protein